MMKSTKSILMLGIGDIGLNQIKWAKKSGFNTIVTDKEENASSFKYADQSIVSDATNSKKIVSKILDKNLDKNLSAVYTGNDFGIVSTAIISNLFNIEGCSVNSAISSIDKVLMKKKWISDSIPTPLCHFIDPKEKSKFINKKFPIIIKPSSSSGSQGVSIVLSKGDYELAFNEAIKYSQGNQILIEEMVNGEHIDANGIFWNNKFFPCGTARRFFSLPPYTVPISGHEPAGIEPLIEKKLFKIFEKAGRSLGLNNTPVKADFIISNGDPKIIELSARFHGDLGLSHNSFYRTGLSPAIIYYEMLMTKRLPIKKLDLFLKNKRYSAWNVLDLAPGNIINLNEAIITAKKSVNVDNVFIDPRKGSLFKELKNNNDVNGFVWASGKNLNEIKCRLNQFKTCLQELVKYD